MRSRALAILTVAALAASGCSSHAITSSALQQAVGSTYQRLYLLQQEELGHVPSPTPDGTAQCLRTGSTGHSGPGSWTCTVHFPYPDGHLVPLSFDVEVQPVGCYVATGAPAIVGQLKLLTPSGRSVTNPLYAFDGCFDPA